MQKWFEFVTLKSEVFLNLLFLLYYNVCKLFGVCLSIIAQTLRD